MRLGASETSQQCFRLVALKHEVQNNAEVVKPVLDELEVLRLSTALGMLSGVRGQDLRDGVLEARDVDDDFARFLRRDVLGGDGGGGSESERVVVRSVFGKQRETRAYLRRVGAWNDSMERTIRDVDQGLYAVLLPPYAVGMNDLDYYDDDEDEYEDDGDGDAGNAGRLLVVFGWLRDGFFEAERLRDTATYVLRFLTTLSSHVTCVIGKHDVAHMQQLMADSQAHEGDDLASYSVAFHVERQLEEQDAIEATIVEEVALGQLDGASDVQMMFTEGYHDELENNLARIAYTPTNAIRQMMDRLEKLQKPMYGLDLARDLKAFVLENVIEFEDFSGAFGCQLDTREFLQTLITFVPIQLCRAEFNMLTIMDNGHDTSTQTLDEKQSLQSADVARSTRFGLYSPLLSSWPGRCVVITSMGKQSTGKSYFLNHLTGSSFAISGERCTDGAWMSVVKLPKNILLVVLDFEGLGSLERTEQEDVFLSVLNASVSMLTIFRMEMRLDKDIDDLFNKFQKGSQLLQGDPRLFRGKLYMSVKDVNPNDQRGIIKEFESKFGMLLAANKEHNFLTEMYSGQLDINCSPPLGTPGAAGFRNGKSFHDCIRLVLAKISILDWTSLDESAQQLRLSEAMEELPMALRFGCLVHAKSDFDVTAGVHKEDLVDALTAERIKISFEQVCVAFPQLEPTWQDLRRKKMFDVCVSDHEVDLGIAVTIGADSDRRVDAASETIHQLFDRFKHCFRITGRLEAATQKNFDGFLSFILRRRRLRIQHWAQSRFGGRVPEAWTVAEQQYCGAAQNLFRRATGLHMRAARAQGTKANASAQKEIIPLVSDGDDDKADVASATVHMCDGEHVCQAMCDEDGVCHVDVFLKKSSKTFEGKRSSFQYTFQEMNGSRKKCVRTIAPGEVAHDGSHSCVVASREHEALHYCDVRCPCCSYYCQKPFGHAGNHKTTHGNMRNTYFLSDDVDIDIGERKYQAGERGTAEMCNMYCATMGREHVHYLPCDQGSAGQCVYSGTSEDRRRHCQRALEPKPEQEMDELLHESFWETLGWEDPCTSKEARDEFGKCGYKCDAPDHDDEKPSLCVLPAWHAPAKQPESGFDGYSYVSGHQFECTHVSGDGKMHHVLVLDASGSMSGSPWQHLMGAYAEYINNRINDRGTTDLVSVITFDSSARIQYDAVSITSMRTAPVQYTGGGTSYASGLRLANEVMSRIMFDDYKPVIVFFSDGHPHDPVEGEQLAQHIRQAYAMYGLKAFAVGFGSINLHILERVATALGGSYHHALDGTELRSTFYTISASLGMRAGLALAATADDSYCGVCGGQLAAEPTTELAVCAHVIHARCLRGLMDKQDASGESAQCPTCREVIHE
ncbi:hypothetical protein ATCC90586_010763 [Pythium insidiosum]|nr:hypothetical protein ATCC90586_010763 [Pythium insidiosum]